jgi:hypothetical protein
MTVRPDGIFNVQTIEAAPQTIAFRRLSIILVCRFDATRHYETKLADRPEG